MPEFYTYVWLREDGSPYYVGKGHDDRAFYTYKRRFKRPADKSLIKIYPWADEATAFAFERYFIDFWGRKDLGTGCLRNLSDGGEGPSNPSEETRNKLRAAAQNPPPERVEAIRKLGYIQGAKNVETGHMERIRKAAEDAGILPAARRKQQQGKKNAENGHMARLGREWGLFYGKKCAESGLLRSVCVAGGKAGSHRRWHVDRGIPNPNCSFCIAAGAV
jgi:hypothetical protein